MAVDNVAERGARMKSVGILCAKYTSLHEHMPFLEEEVRWVQPADYSLIIDANNLKPYQVNSLTF